jgi:uncharacterized protein YggE
MDTTKTTAPNRNKLNLAIDLRIVVVALLILAVAMLAIWRPWSNSTINASSRTVTVTGEATITAQPDEFIFYPRYEFTDTDKQAALNKLSNKSDEIVKKLKDLGVASTKIKTDTNDYASRYMIQDKDTSDDNTYSLQLTVTTTDKQQAQKVQDYLATTAPSSSVSPQASFSKTMKKRLEDQARSKATTDARQKADQMAQNLGFSIKAVKSVTDSSGLGGGVMPLSEDSTMSAAGVDTKQLTVQPGENDLSYSVQVTYYIK